MTHVATCQRCGFRLVRPDQGPWRHVNQYGVCPEPVPTVETVRAL